MNWRMQPPVVPSEQGCALLHAGAEEPAQLAGAPSCMQVSPEIEEWDSLLGDGRYLRRRRPGARNVVPVDVSGRISPPPDVHDPWRLPPTPSQAPSESAQPAGFSFMDVSPEIVWLSDGAGRTPLGFRLRNLIISVNEQLLEAELPGWFTKGPTDDSARQAAKWAPGKKFRDWANSPGSGLFLAMLMPAKFGIRGVRPVSEAFDVSVREWCVKQLSVISPSRQRSSHGINNRRANIIEGLLNYFADLPLYTRLHSELHRAWELMRRAFLLIDPSDLELTHDEQVELAVWDYSSRGMVDDDQWRRVQQDLFEQSMQPQRNPAHEDALQSTNAPTAAAPPLLPIPQHLRLPSVIAHANLLFIASELPAWFLEGPTYASAKRQCKDDDVFKVPNWTKATASAVILAMVDPQKFGIEAPSILTTLRRDADHEWQVKRWTGVSRTGVSKSQPSKSNFNDSRKNLLEAFLNYFSHDVRHEELVVALRRSLELMTRSFTILNFDNHSLDFDQQVQKALACEEAIEDDKAWCTLSQLAEQKWKDECRQEAAAWASEESDRLFAVMLPGLREFADQRQPGIISDGLTFKLIQSWLPGEGFSSSTRGSAMLRRLRIKADAQLHEWSGVVYAESVG